MKALRFIPVLLLVLCVSALAEGGCGCDTKDAFTKGLGTEKKPYIIETPQQFLHMQQHNGCWFNIDNDIDFSGVPFDPLFSEEPFSGVLNGRYKNLTGICVSSGESAGIFACVDENGVIKSLRPQGIVFANDATVHAGGIAGINRGSIQSSDCRMNIIALDTLKAVIGGIAGLNSDKAMISYCSFDGTLPEGTSCIIGAIVGEKAAGQHQASIQHVTAHAGFAAAGGIKDKKEDNTLENVIKAIELGADGVEIDVRKRKCEDGTFDLVVVHDEKDMDAAVPLSSFLDLFLGRHALCENMTRDPNEVKVQFDLKDNAFLPLMDALEMAQFPYSRVICTAHAQTDDEIARLKDAVAQGMELYCEVGWVSNKTKFKYQPDQFIEDILNYPIQPVTLNVSNSDISDKTLEALLNSGIKVSLWTVSDPTYIAKYIQLELHNMTTRNADVLSMKAAWQKGLFENETVTAYQPVGQQD